MTVTVVMTTAAMAAITRVTVVTMIAITTTALWHQWKDTVTGRTNVTPMVRHGL
jgi:hypothetical protein